MRSLIRKITVALLITAMLTSTAKTARANNRLPDFEGTGEAAAGMVALVAVGIAAAVGAVTWLVIANWPEDDLAAPEQAAAQEVSTDREALEVSGTPSEMGLAMIALPPEAASAESERTTPRIRRR
jgi:hypothetical protein